MKDTNEDDFMVASLTHKSYRSVQIILNLIYGNLVADEWSLQHQDNSVVEVV